MSKVNVKFLTLMAVVMILPLTAVAMADTVGEAHAAGSGTESNPWSGSVSIHSYGANHTVTYAYLGTNFTMEAYIDGIDVFDGEITYVTPGHGLSISGNKLVVSGILSKLGQITIKNEELVRTEEWEEKTLTINVIPEECTISYNSQGGNNVADSKVSKGSSFYLPSTARSGYLFDGWYTAATGGTLIGKAGDSYTPSGDATLYAHWTVATATISSSPSTLDTYSGQHWSYTVSALPSDATITVSGASWLSVSGKVISGTVGTPGDYTVTVTASKAGYTSATQTFVIHVVPQLTFESLPSAGFIFKG